MRKALTSHWRELIRAVLIAMGFLWLPIEAYEGLSNTDTTLSFNFFLFLSMAIGVGFYFLDGYFIAGFLKKRVRINPNAYDTEIHIEFGDLFSYSGWKVIRTGVVGD